MASILHRASWICEQHHHHHPALRKIVDNHGESKLTEIEISFSTRVLNSTVPFRIHQFVFTRERPRIYQCGIIHLLCGHHIVIPNCTSPLPPFPRISLEGALSLTPGQRSFPGGQLLFVCHSITHEHGPSSPSRITFLTISFPWQPCKPLFFLVFYAFLHKRITLHIFLFTVLVPCFVVMNKEITKRAKFIGWKVGKGYGSWALKGWRIQFRRWKEQTSLTEREEEESVRLFQRWA